jgi:outer membrane protein TolC
MKADKGQEVTGLKSFYVVHGSRMASAGWSAAAILLLLLATSPPMAGAEDEPIRLKELIDEGLQNSPEFRAFESRVEASKYQIPQAKSLPDPMFMFGYQNEGFQRITIGEDRAFSRKHHWCKRDARGG